MNSDYIISDAIHSDANELTKLVNSAYRGDSSRAGWTTEADLLDGTRVTTDLMEELLHKSGTVILVYRVKNRIHGCVELKIDGSKLYLGMLTVDPNKQGSGIGKLLLKESEKKAKALMCDSIYMSVISKRAELIAWYKRHGYTETGERKPFQLPDSRWGVPKMELEFIYLEKKLS